MKKQKLNICLVSLLIIIHVELFAQTIHAIIVADTEDKSIGIAAKQDMNQFSALLRQVANAIDYSLTTHIIRPEYSILLGNRYDVPKITSLILGLNIEAHDIFFFYYSGHGYTSFNKGDPFATPHITDFQHKYLSLGMVQKLAQIKQPQLSIVMGNLCNGSADTGHNHSLKSQWNAFDNRNKRMTENLKYLFMSQKGSITATSSERGLVSYAQVGGTDPSYHGGIFSILFYNNLITGIESVYTPSWETIFKNTTKDLFERSNRKPYYELDLRHIN